MKARIIRRANVDGSIKFVIQQRHFIFRWIWVDAWINSMSGASCTDSFDTLSEAKKNLCYSMDQNQLKWLSRKNI